MHLLEGEWGVKPIAAQVLGADLSLSLQDASTAPQPLLPRQQFSFQDPRHHYYQITKSLKDLVNLYWRKMFSRNYI